MLSNAHSRSLLSRNSAARSLNPLTCVAKSAFVPRKSPACCRLELFFVEKQKQQKPGAFGGAEGPPGPQEGHYHNGAPQSNGSSVGGRLGNGASSHTGTGSNRLSLDSDGTTAAGRLYDAALADPLHDLSVDFDKTYLNCRCHISIPVSLGSPDNSGSSSPGRSSSSTVADSNSFSTSTLAGFQAYLQYQQLVSTDASRSTSSSTARTAADSSLLQCAVLIAQHAYPSINSKAITAAVDALGDRAAALAAAEDAAAADGAAGSTVRAVAAAVNHVLFEQEGFSGAVEDFYHHDNQCINRLLDTKQGSPALLALLYQLVAAAAGLRLTAVTLPGHTFLAPLALADAGDHSDSNGPISGFPAYLIDPFNAGQVCSSGVVEARLNACWGYPGQTLALGKQLTPQQMTHCDGNGAKAGGHSSSNGSSKNGQSRAQERLSSHSSSSSWCGDRALLVRLLKNLREAYYCPLPLSGRIRWAMRSSQTQSTDSSVTGISNNSNEDLVMDSGAAAAGGRELLTGALAVVRYHRATAPQEARLMRDEGYVLHLLGRTTEGKALLQQYLAAAPAAADAHQVQEFVVADNL